MLEALLALRWAAGLLLAVLPVAAAQPCPALLRRALRAHTRCTTSCGYEPRVLCESDSRSQGSGWHLPLVAGSD